MVGFHFLGDPYFPNQGNRRWIEEDPEEDPEVQREEDLEEQMEDVEEEDDNSKEEEDSDVESKVINPPYVARVPMYRQGYQGPTPCWVEDLQRWSRQQGQCFLYGMERGLYERSHGGPADRHLPIMSQ